MHNTPPRPHLNDHDSDIFEEVEEIDFGNDPTPEDDDLEEVTIEELQERIENIPENGLRDEDLAPLDDSIFTFAEHIDPVFGCAMHPSLEVCVTGGEDDRVLVWHRKTGVVIKELTDYEDTVTDIHFNHDGTYLATGSMAGLIFVHRVHELEGLDEEGEKRYTVKKVWCHQISDLTYLRWSKTSNVLIAGGEEGDIYIFRIPSGEVKVCPGHGARSDAADFTYDDKKFVASYNDGVIKLWDVQTARLSTHIKKDEPMSLEYGSTTVACDTKSPVFMYGGENGKIGFSTPNGPIGLVQARGTVECMAFSPSENFRVAATGTLQGQLMIWDYSKLAARTECDHRDAGIAALKWINDYTVLVGTLSGNMIAYDARTGQRLHVFEGHTEVIYSFCYDPTIRMFLTVSEDTECKLFELPDSID